MIYRTFGKTGIEMPILTCGGMRFQQGWDNLDWKDITEENQKNLEATIRRSFELGINHFETARGYGSSERQLGKILPQLPRDKITVQTKIGPDKNPAVFEKNLQLSFDLLNVEYLDLMAIHGINNDELLETSLKCMDIIKKWQNKGLIRHLGFSTHGESDIIIKTIETGLFNYVNLHYFYIKQSNIKAIKKAEEKNMGVLIISPNQKGGMLYEPSDKLKKLTSPLSPMAFHDLFLLKKPGIKTLSIGVAKPSDFDEHILALEKLDDAETMVEPIVERLDQEMESALGSEWYNRWEEGLPKIKDTPGEISIKNILWLYNLVKAFDLVEYAKLRYNLLENGEHWFPGNTAENLDNVDLTECLKNSPFKDTIPGILKETHELLKGEEVKRLQKD